MDYFRNITVVNTQYERLLISAVHMADSAMKMSLFQSSLPLWFLAYLRKFLRNTHFLAFCLSIYCLKTLFQVIRNDWQNLFWQCNFEVCTKFQTRTRRLAACTQAVIILRSTSYIAIELKCSAFEVVRNSIESMCLSYSAFDCLSWNRLIVHKP